MRFYEQFYGFHALRTVGKCTTRHLFRYGGLVFVLLILWIAIYQVESAIQLVSQQPEPKNKRPFPSCPKPPLQSEANCEAIDMKMTFYSPANETYFHKKGFSLSLVL